MHGDLGNNSSTGSSHLRMLDIASLLNQQQQQSSLNHSINSDINQTLISTNSAKHQLFDIGNQNPNPQLALHGMLSHTTGLNSIANPSFINCTTNYNINNSSITTKNTAAVAAVINTNNIEGGDRLSALTNMSNITSASGEASASTSEERGTTTGHGGGVSVQQQQQQQQSGAAGTTAAMAAAAGLTSNGLSVVVKRKRNLPGTPDPDAEVIALSPKTLMATNRFVCEICNKGFQRDQNLQLHRRGHNLPWKLKQRTNKEIRKRVYICPEPSCVHHDPARALGDLTGIKKHYCRKHGEKKWKCDKCSKRYAVQSDWKAHSKTCGTREYRCDCGTLFSRRDSFITHRAFCDALAEESARVNTGVGNHMLPGGAASLANLAGVGALGMMSAPPPQSPRGGSASLAARFAAGAGNAMDPLQSAALRCGLLSNPEASSLFNPNSSSSSRPRLSLWLGNSGSSSAANHDQFGMSSANDHATAVLGGGSHPMDGFGGLGMGSIFDSYEGPKPGHLGGQMQPGHFNSNAAMALMQQPSSNALLPDLSGLSSDYGALSSFAALNRPINQNPNSTQMAPSSVSPLFSQGNNNNNNNAANSTASAQMSATALLQKAAQMGATASNNSILKGLGAMEAGNNPWPDRSAAGMQVQNAIAQFNALQQQQDRSSAIQFGNKLDSPIGPNGDGSKNLDQNCGIQEMLSAASMATSNAGLMNNSMPPGMNRNIFGDHQSSPFHTRPLDLSGQQRSGMNGQMQSMGQQMQGGMNPRVPKSEDGITRDFLGVRGVNGPLLGGHHQDHQAQLAAMARSVQQQSNVEQHHHHQQQQQQQHQHQQQQQQQHHQQQREQFFYSNAPMDHHHFSNNNNPMSKDHHNNSLRTSSPARSSWDHHGP